MATQAQIERAIRKVEIAIDKLVDLQDMGFGCAEITEALAHLNAIRSMFACRVPA